MIWIVSSLVLPVIGRALLVQNNRLTGPIPSVVGDLVNLLCVPVETVDETAVLILGVAFVSHGVQHATQRAVNYLSVSRSYCLSRLYLQS